MIDSKQLLHELARLKARQVAAGLQVSQTSKGSQAFQGPQGSSHGARGNGSAAQAVARHPGAAPLELHLVTDFGGRVLECDADLAMLLAGETELRGAGIDDFVAISGQPEFSTLFERSTMDEFTSTSTRLFLFRARKVDFYSSVRHFLCSRGVIIERFL